MQEDDHKIPVSDDIQRAWIALQHVGPLLRQRIDDELKTAGMPDLAAYSILWGIDRAGAPIRPRDLGLLLFLERYQISRQIDRMVEEGLVVKRKCPEDKRGHFLDLTEKGRAMRLAMWDIYGPAMARALGPLSHEEARTISTLLNKLA